MFKQIVAVLAIFITGVTHAHAAVVVRTADQLEVAQGTVDSGELLAVGLPVTLSNEVTQDATLIGNQVKINAPVGGDVLAAGFFVNVDAPVNDDVRVVGGEVVISSDISGDLIVLGGSVQLLSTATVGGDVVAYGGSVDISGDVQGNVYGAMEFLTISGEVAQGVDVRAVQLTLGETASITESVRYVSGNLVNQALNASVGGDVVRNDPVMQVESSTITQTLLLLLIGLFTTLVWYLLFNKTLLAVSRYSTQHIVRCALVGAGIVFLAPFAIAILFVSQLGSYIALVALLVLLLLILLGLASLPAIAGMAILKLLGQEATVTPLGIALGAGAVAILLLLPVVGILCIFVLMLLAVGALVETAIKASR